ncbi:hypothetical protein [Roseovarius sp. 217]|uniref:hypothetical protein n=1 Tax=Roseovarius sp. (strain 217) TaxID=314264 RepID=UPI0012EDB24B|nr:hypothetical protein [Roseovarius sp. 217]
MTIFVIMRQAEADHNRLGSAIKRVYPNDTYPLGDGLWLISDSATAVEVSNKIGITSATGSNVTVGSAIVVEAASYYGRANPAIWSWIKTKWEGGPNG